MTDQTVTTRELRSTVTAEGRLVLDLVDVVLPSPGADEIVVRMEGAPINPSDQGLLLGPADLSTMRAEGTPDAPVLVADIPERRMTAMAARIGESMPVGNEGAGTVIAAGENATALIGRAVALRGGGMYATHRLVRTADCLVLSDGITAAEGASAFVNPLTALGMVETMKAEGHSALVHTAAASNLGQMLVRICKADGVPLVCIVRSDEQAALLRGEGAEHVVDSSKEDFQAALTDAIAATGATLAFDAIGGGRLASQILAAMEAALARRGGAYSRYGSSTHKQVYIYGSLDIRPTEIDRSIGLAWGVGGWLLTPFLMKIGAAGTQRLWARVLDELTTTFASRYTATLSLREALDPVNVAAYAKKATGEKYLIDPGKA